MVGTAVEEVVNEGAVAAASAADVAEASSLTITMVPDSADSEAAILGPGGVLEGAASGSAVIDMSSIAPGMSQKIGTACDAAGVEFLDAPVSGGEPKAIDGTLAIMVGGPQVVFDKYQTILEIMGGSVVLCGGYGAGNTTKLANQIIVAINIEAVSEALVLVAKAGLDPKVVYEAIKGGLAGSTVLDAKGTMMIEGNFDPIAVCGRSSSMISQARNLLNEVGGRPGHIFNLGHGIVPDTPVDNVKRLVDFVHEESTR